MDMQMQNQPRPSEYIPESGERNAKRQKVKLACQECRDRKIRCDGVRPVCGSCARKKLDSDRCVFSGANTESADRDDSYTRNLESRVHELEALLKNPSSASSSLSTARQLPITTSGNAGNANTEVQLRKTQFARPEPNQLLPHTRSYNFQGQPTYPATQNLPSNLRQSPANNSRSPSNYRRASRADTSASPASHNLERTSRIVEESRERDESVQQVYGDETVGNTNDEPPLENSPAFLGNSSAVGFMSEVYQTLKSGDKSNGTHESELPIPEEDKLSSRSLWFGHQGNEDSGMGSMIPDFVVPPKRIADNLLNQYWRGAHPLQPFIHQGTFMIQYDDLWSGSADESCVANGFRHRRSLQSEQIFHCILNLIFALGCRFRSMSARTQRPGSDKTQKTFFNRATRLLSLELMDYGSIQLVQALMLMSQYLQTLNLSNRCWVVVGMAIRVAQGIAMHLDIEGESQAQMEERRRTWQSCVLLDRVLSMTFGRPLMLDLQSSGPLPQIIDDEFLTTTTGAGNGSQPLGIPARSAFFVSIIKLSNITAEVLKFVHTSLIMILRLVVLQIQLTGVGCSNRLFYFTVPGTSAKDVPVTDFTSLLRLDAALEDWNEELPPYLQYQNLQEPSDSNDLFVRQAHLLHHRHLYGRVLLFRRVVVQLAASTLPQSSTLAATRLQHMVAFSCVDKCTTAAQDLIDLIQPNIGTWLIPPAWHTVFVIYTAGTIFAVVSLTPSFRQRLEPEQRQRLRRSWDQCVECLKEYQKLGVPFASKCLWNLQKIYRNEDPENRGGDVNSGTQNPVVSGFRNDSDYDREDMSFAKSDNLPYQNIHDQDTSWGSDGWIFNITNPGLGWPNDNIDWVNDIGNFNHDG